jgi:eukaryotic-like serine/threonine-protein kinase
MPEASSERLPRLGRYQVLSKLAEGGMAEIFLAKALGAMGFERLVAIKLIRPHLTEDPDFVKMFLDEARIAMHLHHRNVVQTSDLERANDTYFIAMEFVHGVNVYDLYERVAQRGEWIELPLALYIISEACKGLHFAHTRTRADGQSLGIVHRDISPQNILLSFEGEVKIMDFGIAKATERLHHTMPGIVKGKYAYMAPEILHDKPVDHRVDIFAAGVVLYELLTRENPFAGNTAIETIESVLKEPIVPPSEKCGVGSKALDAIVMKALAKDPLNRFQTARELSAALTDYGLGLTGARWDIAAGDSSLSLLLRNIFPQRSSQTFTQSSAEDVIIPRSQGSHGIASSIRHVDSSERVVTDAQDYAAQQTLLQVAAIEDEAGEIYDEEAQTALSLDVSPVLQEAVEHTTSTTLPPEPATDRARSGIAYESDAGVTQLDQGFLVDQLALDSINEGPQPMIQDRGPTQSPIKQKQAAGFINANDIPDPGLNLGDDTAHDLEHSEQMNRVRTQPESQSSKNLLANDVTPHAMDIPKPKHASHARTASYPSADIMIPGLSGQAGAAPHNLVIAQKRSPLTTYGAFAAVFVATVLLILAFLFWRGEQPAMVSIPVTSQPSGATVIINGMIQEHKTPLSAIVSASHRHRIEISAPGYKTFSKEIDPSGNAPLRINAILSAQ